MGGPSLLKSKSDFLLILLWEPENTAVTASISSRIPEAEVHYFCVQTASKQLLQESRSAPVGVRAASYVFNELLSTSRDFDEETTIARNGLQTLLRRTIILVTSWSLLPNPHIVPNLQMIHLLSAGVDQVIDHPLIKGAHVDITTSSGIHGIPLAEWALMTTLCFRKSFLISHEQQKNHEWPTNKSMYTESKDLYGKRVGIIGYGGIGRQVSRLFSAFGCSIIALTASPRPDADSHVDHRYTIPGTGDPSGAIPSTWISGTDKSSLHRFLSLGLDILVLSIPLLPSTTNLISSEELQVLSENPSPNGKCFLINVARGRVVDQTALVEALNAESIAGAALDVAVPEPLPQDSPLWDAKNVIITPHISTLSSEYVPRAFEILVSNLGRRARGEKLLNLVDREKGY